MERGQFTFYASFADALSRIRKKADRCDAYDAIVRYALSGEEPDMDKLPDAAALAFVMAKPNLDASRRKAEGGRNGGASRPEASRKDNASITEASGKDNGSKGNAEARGNRKQEKEQEREQERERDKGQMSIGAHERVASDIFTEFCKAWSMDPVIGEEGALALLQALKDYEQMRKKLRKPLTEKAAELACKKLEKEFPKHEWIDVVNQSVMNSWLALYPLHEEQKSGGAQKMSGGVQRHGTPVSPMMAAAARRMMEEDEDGFAT